MFDPASIQRCDFCETGQVTRRYKLVSFRQWSDKGYIFCEADVSVGICNRCGAQHWDQEAERIVEDAFQQGYRQKSLNRSGASSV
jgi:hypothetical protein